MNKQLSTYDYIIAGAGCAGLSLVMKLIAEPALRHKKFLLVDSSSKQNNDRTWCFWESKNGFFDEVVHYRWNEIEFLAKELTVVANILPYQYKMIKGIDFYKYCFDRIKQYPNIDFLQQQVERVGYENNKGFVIVGNQKIYAQYVFNSILFEKPKKEPNKYYLLQHFQGWEIESPIPVFNSAKARFMDFTVSQQHGTTFMYVLPVSDKKALIEYTLFTDKVLLDAEYEEALKEYITKNLSLSEYKVLHKEKGIIPMTNHEFPLQEGNVIYIGTAGGQVKPSSGYAFQFIQKRTASIVEKLVNNKAPFFTKTLANKKFNLYDSTLLQVMVNNKMQGDAIFAAIFKKIPPQKILRFLDNETTLLDDISILNSVPTSIFLPAALKEIFL